MAQTSEERPLSAEEMAAYREQATTSLLELEKAAKNSTEPSWVRSDDEKWLEDRSEDCRYFDTHGFLVVPQFVDSTAVQALKNQMADLVETEWDPNGKDSIDTFGTDTASNKQRGDYFLDSSNKVHYFAEPGAMEGQTNSLKPEFETDKLAALNKAGHGMHTVPGAFHDYTTSDAMRSLVTDLGWKDPVVPQSMYIFKQRKVGGTVHSHQDSTFLYTTPRQTCLGLWLALDDATLENGCLWVRPGSHREGLRRQFLRNPAYFDNQDSASETPKLIFEQKDEESKVTWEGSLPESLSKEGFMPVEVKAGDLVTFSGTLDHLSLPNFSDLPRHTFQLHLVEGPRAGITWSPSNWLQYPEGVPFVRLVNP